MLDVLYCSYWTKNKPKKNIKYQRCVLLFLPVSSVDWKRIFGDLRFIQLLPNMQRSTIMLTICVRKWKRLVKPGVKISQNRYLKGLLFADDLILIPNKKSDITTWKQRDINSPLLKRMLAPQALLLCQRTFLLICDRSGPVGRGPSAALPAVCRGTPAQIRWRPPTNRGSWRCGWFSLTLLCRKASGCCAS